MLPAPDYDLTALLHPWVAAAPENGLHLELQREVGPLHPLFKKTAHAIARREDCDEILFLIEGLENPFALVHLTWGGQREWLPQWPSTVFYASWEDFLENRMKPNIQEWNELADDFGNPES